MFERELFIERMKKPFNYYNRKLDYLDSLSDSRIDAYLGKVTAQILEMYEKGLSFNTPEEWDKGFEILGGTQHRRLSNGILKKMTWEQFLYNSYEIIEKHKEENNG